MITIMSHRGIGGKICFTHYYCLVSVCNLQWVHHLLVAICYEVKFYLCYVSFKLRDGLDRYIKKSNWYPQNLMSNLDVKGITDGIIRYNVIAEHHSGIVIRASGGLKVLIFVSPGYLCSMDIDWIADIR